MTRSLAAREADAELGFMARLLALCSLPRTDPGDQHEFKHVNGPYTLYMTATAGNKLPYGSRPRLRLAWVCSEAVRTQSRELLLGDSLSEFKRRQAHSAPQPDEAAFLFPSRIEIRGRARRAIYRVTNSG